MLDTARPIARLPSPPVMAFCTAFERAITIREVVDVELRQPALAGEPEPHEEHDDDDDRLHGLFGHPGPADRGERQEVYHGSRIPRVVATSLQDLRVARDDADRAVGLEDRQLHVGDLVDAVLAKSRVEPSIVMPWRAYGIAAADRRGR